MTIASVFLSTDGVNFTPQAASLPYLTTIHWCGFLGLWFAGSVPDYTSGSVSFIYTSSDGVTWTSRPLQYLTAVGTIIDDGTNIYIAGWSHGVGFPQHIKSTDGFTWTSISIDTNNPLWTSSCITPQGVVFGRQPPSSFWPGTGTIMRWDGTTATDIPNPFAVSGGSVNGLAYDSIHGVLAAVGVAPSVTLAHSADAGATWTTSAPAVGPINGIQWDADNQLYIILAVDGVFSSPDLVTWTDMVAPINPDALVWNGTELVGVGVAWQYTLVWSDNVWALIVLDAQPGVGSVIDGDPGSGLVDIAYSPTLGQWAAVGYILLNVGPAPQLPVSPSPSSVWMLTRAISTANVDRDHIHRLFPILALKKGATVWTNPGYSMPESISPPDPSDLFNGVVASPGGTAYVSWDEDGIDSYGTTGGLARTNVVPVGFVSAGLVRFYGGTIWTMDYSFGLQVFSPKGALLASYVPDFVGFGFFPFGVTVGAVVFGDSTNGTINGYSLASGLITILATTGVIYDDLNVRKNGDIVTWSPEGEGSFAVWSPAAASLRSLTRSDINTFLYGSDIYHIDIVAVNFDVLADGWWLRWNDIGETGLFIEFADRTGFIDAETLTLRRTATIPIGLLQVQIEADTAIFSEITTVNYRGVIVIGGQGVRGSSGIRGATHRLPPTGTALASSSSGVPSQGGTAVITTSSKRQTPS